MIRNPLSSVWLRLALVALVTVLVISVLVYLAPSPQSASLRAPIEVNNVDQSNGPQNHTRARLMCDSKPALSASLNTVNRERAQTECAKNPRECALTVEEALRLANAPQLTNGSRVTRVSPNAPNAWIVVIERVDSSQIESYKFDPCRGILQKGSRY